MFNSKCLYDKPLIQMRQKFKGDLPEYFQKMISSQFWFYMDNDLIEKIVAMRVYPYQNCIALKLKPKGHRDFVSILLKEPELRILKRIWDCNNDGFCCAIRYYVIYCSDVFAQWVRQDKNSKGCLNWYMELAGKA